MEHRDIVVIGASAGGIEALQQIVHSLPEKFPGSIFVTIHFPEHGNSMLPRILSRAGKLPAMHAADGESIVPGRIYIAPPNVHLLLDRKLIRLVRGPRENGNRPAIDPMFRSAAIAFGPRVVGVILSGNLDDGTSGLAAIKRRGGFALVQDPEDAVFPSMPQSAIDHVKVDCIVPLRGMPRALAELMAQPIPRAEAPVMQDDAMENELSAANLDAIEDADHHPGRTSAFSCPDCGGVLWEIQDGEFARFRCRVGHAWTGDALLAKQSDVFDDALWSALRSLEENASLARQLANRQRRRGNERLSERFEAQARAIEARATIIRDTLLQGSNLPVDTDADTAGRATGTHGQDRHAS